MKNFFLALAALALLGAAVRADSSIEPKIGSAAPDFTLNNLEGKPVVLSSFSGKKPVVLVFFSSWSKSCQQELSDLQEVYLSKNADLEVLAVAFDKKKKDLNDFLAKNKVSFPILPDNKLSLLDKYQIVVIPTTYCIDSSGKIAKTFIDYDENVKNSVLQWIK